MKDSEILGTGNSRYLKSAIGAAATWEEVRAMLIAGTFPIDFNGINEAGFAQVGDALNKSNLLKDRTEVALFGSAADRTVDDAFYGIGNKLKLIMSDMASITLTVKSANGNALSGILVHGIYDDSGNEMLTDSSGVIAGYIAEGDSTISISGYADLEDFSETTSVVKGDSITKEISVTTKNFLKITSSQTLKFSGNVSSVDATLVGGGGGGGRGYHTYGVSGSGGGGGYCVVEEDVSFEENVLYPAVVGAGGVKQIEVYNDAGNGGLTSFLGLTAAGGEGAKKPSNNTPGTSGVGNGNGGAGVAGNKSGSAGVAGSVLGFSSFTETVRYGGGGGSGCVYGFYDTTPGSGGSDFGASGGSEDNDYDAIDAPDGTGGGGGGGSYRQEEDGLGSNGGSGCVAIRMHLKAA